MGSGIFSLVVFFGVDHEFCEYVTPVRDDGRVVAVDEANDFGAGVFSPDSEVAEFAGVPEGDAAAGVNYAVSDVPYVWLSGRCGAGFRDQGVCESGDEEMLAGHCP